MEVVQKKISASFKGSLPVEKHKMNLTSPAMSYENIWNIVNQGSSLEIQHSELLLGADHMGTLCPCTYPDSQREQEFSANHIVCTV